MTYHIAGLSPAPFQHLFALDEGELAKRGAMRVRAAGPGCPCRVSLTDALEGESLVLLNHVSHDVAGPFRTSYAIYVREAAEEAPVYQDEAPDYLDRPMLGLRAFDAHGMLRGALLAMPGDADGRIRELFGRPEIASIHAHNAAHHCFLAQVERD